MPPRRERSGADDDDDESDNDDDGSDTGSDSCSDEENDDPSSGIPPPLATAKEQQAHRENPDSALRARAVADLERHFESVQSICDGVTLPQALADLRATFAQAAADVAEAEAEAEKESSRSSDASSSSSASASSASSPLSSATSTFPPDVDALALLLRSGTLAGEEKLRAWRALRRASLARAVAAPWALSALALRTRVALNVLGRHLFLAAHVPPPIEVSPKYSSGINGGLIPAAAAAATSNTNSVSKAAQERFLEWGHALPRRGAARLQRVASRAADSAFARFDLATEVRPEEVLRALSEAHSAVETALLMTAARQGGGGGGGGKSGGSGDSNGGSPASSVPLWRDLLLPAPEEADRFFSEAALAAASAAAAAATDSFPPPPPPFAANEDLGQQENRVPASVAADDALVRGMASELAAALSSPRFSSAAASAARSAAGAAATALENALSPPVAAAAAAGAAAADDDDDGQAAAEKKKSSFSLPFARVVPRAAAVGGALFDPDSAPCADALKRVAASPEVLELCAAVYSGML